MFLEFVPDEFPCCGFASENQKNVLEIS